MLSPLVVISGLPRSGTSLMIAALAAGGLPLLADESRPADGHNPKGYFEDLRVRGLPSESDWLRGQGGRCVKILSHLLPAIPRDVKAKVIFMRRPLSQVVASQNAMLGVHEPTERDWVALLARDLSARLEWLSQQAHLETLEVSYTLLLRHPRAEFSRVRDFLEPLSLEVEKMSSTVDPALHRQRQGPAKDM